MCTCAQTPQGISGLKKKQGLQAGSFPHAVRSERALLPGTLCCESSSYVLAALNFPARFSMCSIARGFSMELAAKTKTPQAWMQLPVCTPWKKRIQSFKGLLTLNWSFWVFFKLWLATQWSKQGLGAWQKAEYDFMAVILCAKINWFTVSKVTVLLLFWGVGNSYSPETECFR